MDLDPRPLALRWEASAAMALTCHRYDRAVYIDCQRQGSIVMVISKGEKSRRYVVSTFGCLPKNENKPFDGSWCLLVSYWPLAS